MMRGVRDFSPFDGDAAFEGNSLQVERSIYRKM
jgi:hypothetical protein